MNEDEFRKFFVGAVLGAANGKDLDAETIRKMAEGPKEEIPSTKEDNIERSNN